MTVEEINGTVVLHLGDDGPPIAGTQDILDVIGQVWGTGAELVSIPANRFDPRFFDLRTGFAGDALQKLVNYQLRLAVVGDISAHLAGSNALRAFVHESNQGTQAWFVSSRTELEARLAAA
jgi:hypothetical protein